VRSLTRKALRDLWHLRSQALAIALVIAGGIANLVMSQATLRSLEATRDRYYAEQNFADAWVAVKRAPESVAGRLAAIDGITRVETRVVAFGNLAVEDFDAPIRTQVLSLPAPSIEAPLNRIRLESGRLPTPGAGNEVVASEAFADAHGLRPGASFRATIHGRARTLVMVGTARSPEFVYQIAPGSTFPDFKRYAVLWMDRQAIEASLDMEGAFNQAMFRFAPGANPTRALAAIDAVVDRHGGLDAFGRDNQLSNRFLDQEFQQLGTMAWLFPTIFLSVAAFLINVVITRLIGMQRDQIAILKAFGYGPGAIAAHYSFVVGLIAALGTGIGVAGGALLGQWLSGVYMQFYRFPYLEFALGGPVIATGFTVTLAAALSGAAFAVVRAARLPPAEAMRPPSPERYRPSLIERLPFFARIGQPTRIIARQIERRPWKALLSILGLALACAIVMIGRFQNDAIDWMVDVQFRLAQRNDLGVNFVEPVARAALGEMAGLPGVERVEPFRFVPVVLHNGTRSQRTVIEGLPPDGILKRPVNRDLTAAPIPDSGLLLTDQLGEILGIQPGDHVEVQVLEGRRRRLDLPVAGFTSEYIGVQGYMTLDALNRALGDGDFIGGARLMVDPERRDEVEEELERRPRVAGLGVRELEIRNFYDSIGESMLTFTFVALVLGLVINFGVVYNAARVALSERGREMASLRVLGFTRGEVSYILLGELAVLVALAIPLGFVLGQGLVWYMGSELTSDLFRIPVIVSPGTYALAALAMVVSALLSALAVRGRIARLDLIEVLKTRE
jgi:putative ABC transport system permease protein